MPAIPTRPELDARLELIESRIEARVTRIEASLQAMGEQLRDTRNDIQDLRSEFKDTRTEVKTIRWWIAGAAIATIFGVAGLNHQLISAMGGAFESGRMSGAQFSQIGTQFGQINETLSQLKSPLDSREQTISQGRMQHRREPAPRRGGSNN